ncbi:hypothetical protein [Amycolatopsis kentuckyensis]|uniref:hypothetical protein n=1 Tax=Amycolatopsis kentuckyensis TaxID=218823 RepID=UPI000A3BE9D7|nr:hypothetical protein [Amycolatopsis kentuckyensis]
MNYYDKDGLPITDGQFGVLISEADYKRVARSTIMDAADPSKVFEVSTVWLGIDHSFGSELPIIFETMVFAEGSSHDEQCDRYSTLADAERGHVEMVTVVAATLSDPVVMDAE